MVCIKYTLYILYVDLYQLSLYSFYWEFLMGIDIHSQTSRTGFHLL